MKKKHMKVLSSLLAILMLAGLLLPVFADGEGPDAPVVQSIDINANYYAGDTDGRYSIVFTVMEEIPAFTQLSLKIGTTCAKVDDAFFENAVLTGGTAKVVREENDATYPLTYPEAKNIPAKTRLCTLTLKESTAAPSAENLTISEFSIIKENESEPTLLSANITVKEGPIVPELNEATQAVYDKLCALPNPATLSFYTQEGSITNLSALKKTIDAAYTAYHNLSLENQNDLATVMDFYDKQNYLDSLPAMVNKMIEFQGLLEIAKATESITEENALSYQFLIHVFDTKKQITLEDIPIASVARNEITQVTSSLESAKTKITSALNTANADSDGGCKTKTYACQEQITNMQKLSNHQYYAAYMSDIESQIAVLKTDVESAYANDTYVKDALLKALNDSSALIQLIKQGIQDIPTMEIKDINLRTLYDINFTRKNTVSNSLDTKISVIVTDKNGKQIDAAQKAFPSSVLSLTITLDAIADKYAEDETYTITAYYHVNGAQFLIDTQKKTCVYYVVAPTPGLGNGTGTGTGLGGGTIKPTTPTGPTTGGTIFPDSNDEPETPSKPDTVFHDIKNYSWAKDAIDTLYNAGIINGMEEGVFNPAGQVTREQFCKMVAELFDLPTGTGSTAFGDVKADAWYAPYITATMQAGYIQGQSGEYFGIGESIMRQDMAVILYRALGDQNSKAILNFSDNETIAPYAKDAIAELVGLGIINGYEDGSFQPRGTATRAEAAKMIYGIYQYLNKK